MDPNHNLSDGKFLEYVEKKVRKTIRKYKLFEPSGKVAVAVSGGKDSTTVLYILKKLGYEVEGITIDAAIGNYTRKNLENLKEVCEKYEIKLHVVGFREEFGKSLCYMRDLLKEKGHDFSSCMLCGILKRYLLNKHARRLEFDYLVTGHNLDDEAQSFLMNVFRNDYKQSTRSGPKPGIVESNNFVRRVKPLYEIAEAEVVKYSKIMEFPVNYEICPCSVGAFRRKFREILDKFEEDSPNVKYNVVRFHEAMVENANINRDVKVNRCESCGEPAAQKVCKTCQIFKIIDEDKGIDKNIDKDVEEIQKSQKVCKTC